MSDKFFNYISEQKRECETLLVDMNSYDNPPDYIETSPEEAKEKYGNDEGGKLYVKIMNISRCYEDLALIYKLMGEDDKAKKMFGILSRIHLPKSVYGRDTEPVKLAYYDSTYLGHYQLRKGVHLDLAGHDKPMAMQCYEWCIHNCTISDETYYSYMKDQQYDDIAAGSLWRGYSLLLLGRYDEAYKYLKEVVPLLNRQKKSGSEMWRIIEYYLPLALVPLCEYKMNPSDDNRLKARTGIEDFVKKIRDYGERLEGYLYYYHLKEVYPDVYAGEEKQASKKPVVKRSAKTITMPETTEPIPSEEHGVVFICEDERADLESLGSQRAFEDYIKKVERLGDFPVITGLYEVYVADNRQEPGPLIEECNKLLSLPDIDEDVREKTKRILDIAEYCLEKDSTVALYYDPEID